MFHKYVAEFNITATAAGAVISLPGSIRADDTIVLAVKAGYNADLEFSEEQSGAPRIPVPDDTALPDNYTYWEGRAENAPIWAFAAADTSIAIMLFKVRG